LVIRVLPDELALFHEAMDEDRGEQEEQTSGGEDWVVERGSTSGGEDWVRMLGLLGGGGGEREGGGERAMEREGETSGGGEKAREAGAGGVSCALLPACQHGSVRSELSLGD
jgi:hypothetical protein